MDENHSYNKSTHPFSNFDTAKSELQLISPDFHQKKHLNLYVKRDDLIDSEVSGNKWRKLMLNIELAAHLKKDGIVTFGGAYSNHLLATASACNRFGLKSIGIVRGDELSSQSNSNLRRCEALGMKLVFIARSAYDCQCETGEQDQWKETYSTYHMVPEGGANYHGIIGCQEIIHEIAIPIQHVFVAQGTGATSCGILTAVQENTKVHAVPVLKGFDVLGTMNSLLLPIFLDDEVVAEYLSRVEVHADAHFGGYGKWNTQLEEFLDEVRSKIGLPLDKVYTGKAFYALLEWIKRTDFQAPTNVVFIHTGGLLNA